MRSFELLHYPMINAIFLYDLCNLDNFGENPRFVFRNWTPFLNFNGIANFRLIGFIVCKIFLGTTDNLAIDWMFIRRSIKTETVLSILSDTTLPISVRFSVDFS